MNVQAAFKPVSDPTVRLLGEGDTIILVQLTGAFRLQSGLPDRSDKVHPAPRTLDGFDRYRIGDMSHSRQTWVKQDQDQEVVTAALYSACFYQTINTPRDLHGNVASILNGRSILKNEVPQSIIFYSISSFEKGEGRALIKAVHAYLSRQFPGTVLATLSPLRGLTAWLENKGIAADAFHDAAQDDKIRYVMDYIANGENSVARFHLGNGATVADIKFNANSVSSDDARLGMNVMVNYGYPNADRLADNRQAYKSDRCLTVSEHLHTYVPHGTNCRVGHCLP